MRDAFIHHIQKIYGQGVQDVTKSLDDTMTVDFNSEDPRGKIYSKTYDKRKETKQKSMILNIKSNWEDI